MRARFFTLPSPDLIQQVLTTPGAIFVSCEASFRTKLLKLALSNEGGLFSFLPAWRRNHPCSRFLFRASPAPAESFGSQRLLPADRIQLRPPNGGQLSDSYTSSRFRFYRRMADLPEGLSFHSLRHTFASWFVMRGGDLYRLKEIMGHADMKTTLRYARLRPDALVEEMEKCYGEGLL